MTFQNIVLAGATGYLGKKVLAHLLSIPTVKKVTVLTRPSTSHDFPSSPILSVVPVPSYEDHAHLTSILGGHDIVISTIGGAAAQKTDTALLSAAIAAGVQRFIPSEYTLDTLHPHAIEIAGSTVLASRVRTAQELQAVADKGEIEYTTLVTGAIMDWWFENGNLGIDFKGRKVMLYGGGEKETTGCTADFIAQCVGAVVRMPPKATKNKRIRIAEVVYTGKKLKEAVEDVTGEKWEVEEKSIELLLADGRKAGANGDLRNFYLGNVLALNFDGEGAGFFEEGLSHGDEQVERKSLKEIVKAAVLANSN